MKNIDVIGMQLDLGASKSGVSLGPLAIRYANLIPELKLLGYNVCDKGDIIPSKTGLDNPKLRNYSQINNANKELYFSVLQSLKTGSFPLVIGGDHSIAAGSASAVSKFYEGNIGVIWIDAHGDWNNEKTTKSGNMHGMPFSAICGHGPNCMVNFEANIPFINPSSCVVVGARDLDDLEAERMKKSGVTVFTITDIEKKGIENIMLKAIEIASSDTQGIHLSFDVDAISPVEAPGTGTPVNYGLTSREAILAVSLVAESNKMLSMDLVEVNPILDIKNQTAILAVNLITFALGKKYY